MWVQLFPSLVNLSPIFNKISHLQVIQAAALTRYHDALQRWEEEKARQRDEFTITDKNLTKSQEVLIDKVFPHIQNHIFDSAVTVFFIFFTFYLVTGTCSSSSKKNATAQEIQGGLHLLQIYGLSVIKLIYRHAVKYLTFSPLQTLPPICASGSCETVGTICTKVTRAERRAQRETAKAWRRPEPPQPALLHLGVTAQSHR